MDMNELQFIQEVIGYEFVNKNLLVQAFIRKSYTQEHPDCQNNEILEFFGDRALDSYVTKKMYDKFTFINNNNQFCSKKNEGELTEIKAFNVEKETLAHCIEVLEFERFLIIGNSENIENVVKSDSAKEDLFEAIIGAVAVDHDWNQDFIDIVCGNMLSMRDYGFNYISFLANWCTKNNLRKPLYSLDKPRGMVNFSYIKNYPLELWNESERDFEGNYKCMIDVNGIQREGKGTSKILARMSAAENAYNALRSKLLISAVGEPGERNPVIQLHELYQKGYIDEPEYNYEESHDDNGNPIWTCNCEIIDRYGNEYSDSVGSTVKKEAKRDVAYNVLCDLIGYDNQDYYNENDDYDDYDNYNENDYDYDGYDEDDYDD